MQKQNGKLKYALLIFLILSLACFLIFCFLPEYSVTGQLLRQEQAIATAEAENIESFIGGIGNDLITVSQDESVVNPGTDTNSIFESFVDKWGKNNLITGISLTDASGVVTHNYSNISPVEIGTSLSDRDYYIWAKSQINSDNYIVGEPVIARYGINKNKYITPLAAPVFKDGVFSGILATAIRIDEMTNYFLSLMSASDRTDSYILGQNGYLLVNSSKPGFVGENIRDSKQQILFSDNKDLNKKIYYALKKEKKGSTIAAYIDPLSDRSEIHAVAYSPVVLSGRHWLVIISTPASEVTKASTPTYIQRVSVLLFLVLAIITVAILLRRGKN